MQNASRDLAIDELYEAHRAAVMRVCSSILRNADDAADATQEVFLIALESLDPAAKNGTARAWLLTVARNHCLDLLRRRKRLGKALTTLGPDDSRKTDMETAVADRDFVDVVLKQLSARERLALWQSAVESRPLAEIASGLRLSYMAAAQVLHRARRHAVQAATRVAVALGIVHLGRQRVGTGLLGAVQRLAAVAALPVIVVSMNASSPIPPAASSSTAPNAISAPGRAPAAAAPGGSGALPGQVPGVLPNPDSVLPGSTATLNPATDAVDRLLQRPLPSVPPVVSKPPVLPSVPALPSPPAIP
ncbi:MAG TPA: sigma-70 family RNA polymerase sigma factor [Gemmataceae bacterium]|nr:sigma-70 family RNA polymerase sigma factor [Gemmataceae bacterium]